MPCWKSAKCHTRPIIEAINIGPPFVLLGEISSAFYWQVSKTQSCPTYYIWKVKGINKSHEYDHLPTRGK